MGRMIGRVDSTIKEGQIYNRLTVISFMRMDGSTKRWLCKCVCGNKITVAQSNLRSGHTKSCGCLSREIVVERSTKHNHANRGNFSAEYKIWASMRQRCNDPNYKNYCDYGGRGITVYSEWDKSFQAFYDYIGPRPGGTYANGKSLYSLNRIDNDGNYEPGNVEWTIGSIQCLNRRKPRVKNE